MIENEDFRKQDEEVIADSDKDQKKFIYANELKRANDLFQRLQASTDDKEKEELAGQFAEQMYIVNPDRVKEEYSNAFVQPNEMEAYQLFVDRVKESTEMQVYHQAVLQKIIEGLARDVDRYIKSPKSKDKLMSVNDSKECNAYLHVFEDTVTKNMQDAAYKTMAVPSEKNEKDRSKVEAAMNARKEELLANPMLLQAATYFYNNRYNYDLAKYSGPAYKPLFRGKFLLPYLKTIQNHNDLLKTEKDINTDHDIKTENVIKTDNVINTDHDIKTENVIKTDNVINTDHDIKTDNVINTDQNINMDNMIHTNEVNHNMVEEPEKVRERPQPTAYVGVLTALYGRLEATEHGLYQTARDSDQFTNLLNAMKTVSDIVKEKGANLQHDDLRISNLRAAAKEYLAYCTETPKKGSRRKTRMKNAERLLQVCNAWDKKNTMEEHLDNEIAEFLYRGNMLTAIRNEPVRDRQEELWEDYVNSTFKEKAIKDIQASSAFARTVGSARDIFDRYHMFENKAKTRSKFNLAVSRDIKQKEVKNKTIAKQQSSSKSRDSFVK